MKICSLSPCHAASLLLTLLWITKRGTHGSPDFLPPSLIRILCYRTWTQKLKRVCTALWNSWFIYFLSLRSLNPNDQIYCRCQHMRQSESPESLVWSCWGKCESLSASGFFEHLKELHRLLCSANLQPDMIDTPDFSSFPSAGAVTVWIPCSAREQSATCINSFSSSFHSIPDKQGPILQPPKRFPNV